MCLFCGLSLFAFANKTVKQLRTFLPFSSPTPLLTLQITPIGTEITSTRTRTVSSLQHRICFPAIGTNMLPSHFFVPRYARAEVAAKRTNSFFGPTRNSTATATSTKDKNSSFGPKVFTRVHTGGLAGRIIFYGTRNSINVNDASTTCSVALPTTVTLFGVPCVRIETTR